MKTVNKIANKQIICEVLLEAARKDQSIVAEGADTIEKEFVTGSSNLKYGSQTKPVLLRQSQQDWFWLLLSYQSSGWLIKSSKLVVNQKCSVIYRGISKLFGAG